MLIDTCNGIYFIVANASRGIPDADVGTSEYSRWTTSMNYGWSLQIL
jgi:hypothetical protein